MLKLFSKDAIVKKNILYVPIISKSLLFVSVFNNKCGFLISFQNSQYYVYILNSSFKVFATWVMKIIQMGYRNWMCLKN